mmetsp:Transcript_12740/g.25525  ORF Transcript_12740/g.25525 Transcript_12740/m.25525 type:complete len:238 (-) Transcript_12740:444-1157(-)
MKAMNSATLVDFRLPLLKPEPQLPHRKELTKTSATLVTLPLLLRQKPKTTMRKDDRMKVTNLSMHNLLLKMMTALVNLVISLRLKKLLPQTHPQITSKLHKSKRKPQKTISPLHKCSPPHKQFLLRKTNLETLVISTKPTKLRKAVLKMNQVNLFMCLMKMFVTCSRKCFKWTTLPIQKREMVAYSFHLTSLCARYLHHANQPRTKRVTTKPTRVKKKSTTLQITSSHSPRLLHLPY